jgi:hypothetical protein
MNIMELEFKYSKHKKDVLFVFDDLYCYNNIFCKRLNISGKYTIYNYSMNVFCNVVNTNRFGISCSYYTKKGFYLDAENEINEM